MEFEYEIKLDIIKSQFDETGMMVAEESKLGIEREKYIVTCLWYCVDPRLLFSNVQLL